MYRDREREKVERKKGREIDRKYNEREEER
jgi:hypothetical protein